MPVGGTSDHWTLPIASEVNTLPACPVLVTVGKYFKVAPIVKLSTAALSPIVKLPVKVTGPSTVCTAVSTKLSACILAGVTVILEVVSVVPPTPIVILATPVTGTSWRLMTPALLVIRILPLTGSTFPGLYLRVPCTSIFWVILVPRLTFPLKVVLPVTVPPVADNAPIDSGVIIIVPVLISADEFPNLMPLTVGVHVVAPVLLTAVNTSPATGDCPLILRVPWISVVVSLPNVLFPVIVWLVSVLKT